MIVFCFLADPKSAQAANPFDVAAMKEASKNPFSANNIAVNGSNPNNYSNPFAVSTLIQYTYNTKAYLKHYSYVRAIFYSQQL